MPGAVTLLTSRGVVAPMTSQRIGDSDDKRRSLHDGTDDSTRAGAHGIWAT